MKRRRESRRGVSLAVPLEGELVDLEPLGERHREELWRAAQAPEIWRWLADLGGDRGLFDRWFDSHDPLNIYRYSDALYDRALSFPGAPNRMLAEDYASAAQSAGFTATIVGGRTAPASYLNRVRPALTGRFRSRLDLSTLSFTLVCR